MTVCRYFLQGNCRFGERCRFEHTDSRDNRYDSHSNYSNKQNRNQYEWVSEDYKRRQSQVNKNYDESFDRSHPNSYSESFDRTHQNRYNEPFDRSHQNRYNEPFNRSHQNSYNEPSNRNHQNRYNEPFNRSHQNSYNESFNRSYQKSSSSFSFKDPGTDIDSETDSDSVLILAEVVKEDVTAWELGKQWPFTCYSPFVNKAKFPGFNDVSFEELRYEALKSEQNNTFNIYVESVQKAINDVINRRNQLKLPTKELLAIVKKLKAGEIVKEDGQTGGGFSLMHLNHSAVEDISTDSLPLHGRTQTSGFSFKSVLDPHTSVKTAAAASFSFKSHDSENVPTSSFTPVSSIELQVYSPMETLSVQDKEQFSASTFTLGKIPTLPPPKEMCF